MSSINTISVEKLARLIGTPKCPALIDVGLDEDFAVLPRLIPGSVRRPYERAAEWAREFAGRSAIVICQKGLKLSQGAAAWLRHEGVPADSLEGGIEAWARAGLPMVQADKLPRLDAHGRTVWVTRSRPKIDRIACPWLIRRFVDPAAVFLFVSPPEVLAVAERFGAAPFDVEGVFWSHRGERCTFDTMIEEFDVSDRAARASRDNRARRRYRPPRSRAGSGRPARSLPRPLADVCRRPGPARGRACPLRRILSVVPGRDRRDPQLAIEEAGRVRCSRPRSDLVRAGP